MTDIGLCACSARQLAAKIAENCDTADPEHRIDSALSKAIVTSHGKVLLVLPTRSPHVGEFFTGKLDTNEEMITENTTMTI